MQSTIYNFHNKDHQTPLLLKQALARISLEVDTITKDSRVSFSTTKYEYATIGAILAVLNPLLEKEGIAISHRFEQGEGNLLLHEMSVFHIESGAEMLQYFSLPSPANNPKDAGSGHTYQRRYALLSLFNLVTEDDDANKASGWSGATATPKRPTSKRPPNRRPSTRTG